MNIRDIPLADGVEILLYDPVGILAVAKPAGLRSHPNQAGERAAILAPYDSTKEFYRLNRGKALYLCNRLDSPTSGILLFATGMTMAKAVKRAFLEKRVKKRYLAAVLGKPLPEEGRWEDTLTIRKRGDKLRVQRRNPRRADTTGKTAVSRYHTVASHSRLGYQTSLVCLYPETGRTHQLRVQAAQRKYPILGDRTYGDFAKNRELRKKSNIRRMLLHAWEIRIETDNEDIMSPVEVKTDLPDWCKTWFPSFKG